MAHGSRWSGCSHRRGEGWPAFMKAHKPWRRRRGAGRSWLLPVHTPVEFTCRHWRVDEGGIWEGGGAFQDAQALNFSIRGVLFICCAPLGQQLGEGKQRHGGLTCQWFGSQLGLCAVAGPAGRASRGTGREARGLYYPVATQDSTWAQIMTPGEARGYQHTDTGAGGGVC
jgi:hypothetical protein